MRTPSRIPTQSTSKGTSEEAESAVTLGRWWRRIISVLVLAHLTAVTLAPFSFASSSPSVRSPVAIHLLRWFRPYIQFAFLDHGYFFFAPNPGPSHLLRCRVKTADGNTVERIYPDRQLDYPRLLYHRHFMLAEQLNTMFVPPTPPPIPENTPEYRDWQAARREYEARKGSFINHLRHVYRSDNVELTRVEHRPISPEQLRRGAQLSDRALYLELPENPDPGLSYPDDTEGPEVLP
jgi:hypothetical protein